MLAAALVTDGTAVSILYFLLSPNPNEACPISRYGVPSLQPMPRENPMSGWLTVLKVSNHCVLRRGKSVVWAKDKKVIYSTTIRWLALAVRLDINLHTRDTLGLCVEGSSPLTEPNQTQFDGIQYSILVLVHYLQKQFPP